MIYPFDTHLWVGESKDGDQFTMMDHYSFDDCFTDIEKIRIEPLFLDQPKIILAAEKPQGYTLLFRRRARFLNTPMNITGMRYVLGAERGSWTAREAAGLNFDNIPLKDGFRLILDWDGIRVLKRNTSNWILKVEKDPGYGYGYGYKTISFCKGKM